MAHTRFEDDVAVLEAPETEPSTEAKPQEPPPRIEGIVLGRLLALPSSRRALVTLNGRDPGSPVSAKRVAGLTPGDVGREVAVMFEGCDPHKPSIIGLMESAPHDVPAAAAEEHAVEFEAEAIVLSAGKEIVLRCGSASITLTRAGKILIRGDYVLSRSSGVNRIKGGSVQIN